MSTSSLTRLQRVARLTLLGCIATVSTAHAAVIFQENFANGPGQFTATARAFADANGARLRGGAGNQTLTSRSISTTGFTNIRLSFDRATTGLDANEPGIAAVSINGGAFTTLESTTNATGRRTIALAANAAGGAIVVRFSLNASSF